MLWRRFNELRKVRNKTKMTGPERPFSRMYNFYVLEQGDKWAKTGTRFKPRRADGYPDYVEPPLTSAVGKADGAGKTHKTTPKLAPQRPTGDGARASQALSNRTTPLAIKPVVSHNANILGNRSTPPPASLPAGDASLLGKRRLPGDEGARRHKSRSLSSTYAPGMSASYHHVSRMSQEEQTYLNRLRPEVRDEVLRYQAPAQRSHHHYAADRHDAYANETPAAARSSSPEGDYHDYLYRMPQQIRIEAVRSVTHAVDLLAHTRQGPPLYHPAMQACIHSAALAHAPVEALLMAAALKMKRTVVDRRGYPAMHARRYCDVHPALVSDDELCEDEQCHQAANAHDDEELAGSCHTTPEGMQAVCQTFAGSPLDLAMQPDSDPAGTDSCFVTPRRLGERSVPDSPAKHSLAVKSEVMGSPCRSLATDLSEDLAASPRATVSPGKSACKALVMHEEPLHDAHDLYIDELLVAGSENSADQLSCFPLYLGQPASE